MRLALSRRSRRFSRFANFLLGSFSSSLRMKFGDRKHFPPFLGSAVSGPNIFPSLGPGFCKCLLSLALRRTDRDGRLLFLMRARVETGFQAHYWVINHSVLQPLVSAASNCFVRPPAPHLSPSLSLFEQNVSTYLISWLLHPRVHEPPPASFRHVGRL